MDTQMTNEGYFLRRLSGFTLSKPLRHLPIFYETGYFKDQTYLKLEFVDYSIEEYLERTDIPGPKLTIVQVFAQMFYAIRSLHEVGLIHRDVKPDNFRITKYHVVKILDFGTLAEYNKEACDLNNLSNKQNNHKPWGKFGFQGTPYFASIRALAGCALSRRDDLECLGYSMMYIVCEEMVPWKGMGKIEEFKRLKESFLTNDACNTLFKGF